MNFFTDNDILVNNIEAGMEIFISWMEDKEDYQDSCQRLKSLLNEGRHKEVALDLFKEGETHELQVIQHGDVSGSNILFKYGQEDM